MDEQAILDAAARMLGDGIDPAKVDAAVRRRTGMSLSELGAKLGNVPRDTPEAPKPSAGEQRQERFLRATGVTPAGSEGAENAQDQTRLMAHGAAFGLTDELRGAMAGVIPGGEGYTEARDTEREALAEARGRRSPLAAGGLEAMGGLAAPGMGAARFIGKGVGTGAKMLRGAAAGGTAAAAYGAGGEGGPTERGVEALKMFPIGATLGGVASGAVPLAKAVGRGAYHGMGFIGRATREVSRELRGPLRNAESWVREQAREAGTKLTPAQVTRRAEIRLAQLEGDLMAPMRPKPPQKPPEARPDTYEGLVAAQAKIERELGTTEAARPAQTGQSAHPQPPRRPSDLRMEPVASATPAGTVRMAKPPLRLESSLPPQLAESPIGRALDPVALTRQQPHATQAQMAVRSAPILSRVSGLDEIRAVGLKAFQEGDQATLDAVNSVLKERGMAFDWTTIAEEAAKQGRRGRVPNPKPGGAPEVSRPVPSVGRTMTATVEGRSYEIPERWMQGATLGGRRSQQEAVQLWHEQALAEEAVTGVPTSIPSRQSRNRR